ncbi:unnamed protein product [Pedinophyceae sp. YPF-701]|nr:unnamed protein product [Pedinophyceae sp. YPF-701]
MANIDEITWEVPEAATVEDLEPYVNVMKAFATACDTDDQGVTNVNRANTVKLCLWVRRCVRTGTLDSRKKFQAAARAAGLDDALLMLAETGFGAAFCALEALVYRNEPMAVYLAKQRVPHLVARLLGELGTPSGGAGALGLQVKYSNDPWLTSAMLYLLAAMAAFSFRSHASIIDAGLLPVLVRFSHLVEDEETAMADAVGSANSEVAHTRELLGSRVNVCARASAVLRNLAHNRNNHTQLISGDVPSALHAMVESSGDASTRVHAATALACLSGGEEDDPTLMIAEPVVVEILATLDAAIDGREHLGQTWTVWKLVQGLARLSINETNKAVLARHGAVELIARILEGKHHKPLVVQRFTVRTCWNLCFLKENRQAVLQHPTLVPRLQDLAGRSARWTFEDGKLLANALKGCLWTLGMYDGDSDFRDVLATHSSSLATSSLEQSHALIPDSAWSDPVSLASGGVEQRSAAVGVGHVMLSYNWQTQGDVLLLRDELQARGYETWVDVDRMRGSTLEAMARAIEEASVVLICYSRGYKESQACRLEAEYAFQLKKPIVPVRMEDWAPSGWLGVICGSRMYYDLFTANQSRRARQERLEALLHTIALTVSGQDDESDGYREAFEEGRLRHSGRPLSSVDIHAHMADRAAPLHAAGNVAPAYMSAHVPSGSAEHIARLEHGRSNLRSETCFADVVSWDVSEVEEWARDNGMPWLTAAVRREEIDGGALLGLRTAAAHDPVAFTAALKTELVLRRAGHRFKLLHALQALCVDDKRRPGS